jgi:signal peptidase I
MTDSTPSRSVLREYFEALIVAGLFLGFTNTFAIKTFYIPSPSMEDTLLIGDHLFVNRFIYGPESSIGSALLPGREIQRGDVVIFRSPESPRIDLVKRCVGLPGDKVELVDKELYLNGVKVDDNEYTSHRDSAVFPRRSSRAGMPPGYRPDNFGPLTVPEDNYFCMGDNRDHSYDSRFWGTVPSRYVKGRAFLVYWSYGGQTSDGTWHGWSHRLRQLANTVIGFPTKSRWRRTFHLVR